MNQENGCRVSPSGSLQRCLDVGKTTTTHIVDDRIRIRNDGTVGMTIDQRHTGADASLCQADLGGGSQCGRRRDARNNRYADEVALQIFYFFAGMTEHHRVATLQTNNFLTLTSSLQ